MALKNELLLVIDLQKGFIKNENNPVVDNIKSLLSAFEKQSKPSVMTKFINLPNSPFRRWVNWHQLEKSGETDLIEGLKKFKSAEVFEKYRYSAFAHQLSRLIKQRDIQRIYLTGVDTDACVLKSAFDCFENDIEPVVISDACESSAGWYYHEMGLSLIERHLGKRQLQTTQTILNCI